MSLFFLSVTNTGLGRLAGGVNQEGHGLVPHVGRQIAQDPKAGMLLADPQESAASV